MIFNDWPYRKKNRALLLLAFALLLLSWYLAFGKTYALISQYNQLKANLSGGQQSASSSRLLREKLSLQDSLLRQYTQDSTLWTSNLLSQAGTLLSTQAVGVSFENKSPGSGALTVERELLLNGSFAQLQQALRVLERAFFIKSIRAYSEKDQLKYAVRLVVVKKPAK